ncbi:MAG: hypothetical protein AB9915_02845 [Candidatus Dojkabacteria bacterium]
MEENTSNSMEESEVEQSPVSETPKKKTNGCLIAAIIALVLLLLFVGAGYWGYKKIMKLAEGTDFGVKYSQQDYDELMSEIGVEASPEVLCLDCPTPTFSDPEEVSVTVTNEQASAAFEYVNKYMSFAKISGTQIKMSDGKAELMTTLTFQGKTFPLYMSGTVSKSSDSSITGEVFDLKAGGLTLPSNINSLVETGLLNIVNDKLDSAGDNVRIDTLELTESGLDFEGLIPTKAK